MINLNPYQHFSPYSTPYHKDGLPEILPLLSGIHYFLPRQGLFKLRSSSAGLPKHATIILSFHNHKFLPNKVLAEEMYNACN